MKKLLFSFLILFFEAKADTRQIEADAKAFGLHIQNQYKNNTYKAEDVPGFITSNPQEAEYYGNTRKLETDGANNFSENENARLVIKTADEKLQYMPEANQIKENIAHSIEPLDFYCASGKCAEEYKNETANPNKMKDPLTALSVLQEIEKDAKKDNKNIRIFRGEVNSCTRDKAGYNNCCKSSGWGQGMGANCNANEKNLGLKREKKQCLYYRTYCSKEIDIGFSSICTVYTEEYCCFSSNLNKIIAENGRKQLGIPLGSTRTPTGKTTCQTLSGCRSTYIREPACRGFSADELSKIKMDKIDFTEFTNTLNPQMNNIDKDLIQTQINQVISRDYASHY